MSLFLLEGDDHVRNNTIIDPYPAQPAGQPFPPSDLMIFYFEFAYFHSGRQHRVEQVLR